MNNKYQNLRQSFMIDTPMIKLVTNCIPGDIFVDKNVAGV